MILALLFTGIMSTSMPITPSSDREASAVGAEVASQVSIKAEAYNGVMGEYPTREELANPPSDVPEAKLGDLEKSLIDTKPTEKTKDKVKYAVCHDTQGRKLGAEIYYWNASSNGVKSITRGYGSVSTGRQCQ